MTTYKSQVGEDGCKIQFETDNTDHYMRVQKVIWDCVEEEESGGGSHESNRN